MKDFLKDFWETFGVLALGIVIGVFITALLYFVVNNETAPACTSIVAHFILGGN